MKITVIGAGYVGLVTAVCLADAGFDVVCVDKDTNKIELLNKGETPFYEPGLKKLMTKNKKNITFTTDWSNVNCQMSIVKFICVGTPPQEDGSPDMTAYWSVIDEIVETPPWGVSGEVYIINKSTVPVGTARKAQEKLGNAFTVVSMPEFLREGKAIHDFKNPDRVVVGVCRDVPLARLGQQSEGDVAPQRLYSRSAPLLEEGLGEVLVTLLKIFFCPILTMSWESAELTKYAANAFLATKISFINEIARLCEKVGANVDDIAQGIGHDPRIGQAFLKAGFGYGGSCFPKDVRALSALAGVNNYEFELLKATIEVNQSQREFVLQKIVAPRQGHVSIVAILGLAFKGDTDDIRESPALWLIQELVKKGIHVQCYDPRAMDNARRPPSPLQDPVLNTFTAFSVNSVKEEGRGTVRRSPSPLQGEGRGEVLEQNRMITFANSPESCLNNADMVVIATEWEEFKHLDWNALKKLVKNPVIVDAKNLLDKDELETIGWRYEGVGR